MTLPENAPSPRLCHLIKWPDFDGYGFNLHAEKTKTGQYIGKVDDDSPAKLAGLREGDKIIEVNSVNISNENHRQVVERIKSIPNETKLLVVEDSADKWYRERKIVIKNSQTNVIYIRTPVPRPPAGTCPMPCTPEQQKQPPQQQQQQSQQPSLTSQQSIQSSQSTNSLSSSSIKSEEAPAKVAEPVASGTNNNNAKSNESGIFVVTSNATSARASSSLSNGVTSSSNSSNKADSITNSPISSHSSVHDIHPHQLHNLHQNADDSASSSSSLHKGGGDDGGGGGGGGGVVGGGGDTNVGLNLNMSASEMRQLIAQRKKKDPRKANIPLHEKHEMIQQM